MSIRVPCHLDCLQAFCFPPSTACHHLCSPATRPPSSLATMHAAACWSTPAALAGQQQRAHRQRALLPAAAAVPPHHEAAAPAAPCLDRRSLLAGAAALATAAACQPAQAIQGITAGRIPGAPRRLAAPQLAVHPEPLWSSRCGEAEPCSCLCRLQASQGLMLTASSRTSGQRARAVRPGGLAGHPEGAPQGPCAALPPPLTPPSP